MKKIFVLFTVFLLSASLFAKKPTIAVWEIDNKTVGKNKLSQYDAELIADLMRDELIQADEFTVMSKEEMESAIAQHVKKSHQLNKDKNYAIELGKQISARYVVTSWIKTDENGFRMFAEITDTETATTVRSGRAKFVMGDGSKDAAIAGLIRQLLGERDESLIPKKPKKSEGQIACEEAKNTGSEQKWKSFLKYYADEYPECVPEARKQLEEIAFHKADRKNTVEAWQEYLEEYPMANKRHVIEAEEQIEKLTKGNIKKQPSGNISESNNNDAAILGDLLPEYNEYMKIKFDNISFPKKHKGYELLLLGFDVENGKIIHHGDFDPDELYPEEKALVRAAAKIKDDFNNISQARIAKKVELSVILSKTLESKVYPGQTKAVFYYIGKIYKDLADQMSNAPIPPWFTDAMISEYKNHLDEKAFGAAKNAVTYFNMVVKESISIEWINKAKNELQQIKTKYHLN